MNTLAEKLQRALDSACVGIWEWEIGSGKVEWSGQVEELFGMKRGTFDGSFAAYYALIHPGDHAMLERTINDALEGRTSSYAIEHRVLWPDGSVRWIEGKGSVHRDAHGRPERMTGTVMDATARKQAEEAVHQANQALQTSESLLLQFIKHTPAAVAMFDREMRYLHVAERWLVDYHLELHDIVGKSHYEVFTDIPERWKEVHRRVLAGHVERCDEDPFQRADGTTDWLQWEVRPWRDGTGEIGGVIMFTQVITERKRVEAEVRQLQEQKRQAQKLEALGTLAGGIAHDFNNILGAIVAFTEGVMMDRPDDAELQEQLSQVLQASTRATDLVRQILSFSRQQPQARAPTQLARVVDEALNLLRATLPSTIEIVRELAPNLPEVSVDATQIHQVVMNLGTNAAHAMDGRGQFRVRLDAFTLEAGAPPPDLEMRPGRYVRLTASDTGHGIDESTRNRIFDPFFTTKPPGSGTGLGLAVAHGIIKEHGGAITVHSEPGRGTSFTIYLPAAAPHAREQADDTARKVIGHGQRVLFVDDEELLCTAARIMLKRAGYEPLTFVSSEEAWLAIEREPDSIALVITDLTMPGMTGLELASKVTQLRPELPVILASGYLDPRAATMTAQAGVRRVLTKPVDFAALTTAIADLLRD